MTTDLRELLQTTLGDRYTLERELGGGGMARVFVAEEVALGRRVVVKVPTPEFTEGLSAERFAREVRLAARLQHPNIVPVHAAGGAGGLPYYTMPYVEGESLRGRLVRDGRLSLDAAMAVLGDVARALAYAHAHGVVHRDVKPENILLAGGAAVVADFGVAKALDAARTQGAGAAEGGRASGALTRTGTSLGTPAYMAPEQAAGDPDVDARADVYAWGVVAYELLAGAPPFVGLSAHHLVAAHIGEAPTPLGDRAPDVPPALVALVMRCLEKAPAKRPQTGGELLAALEATRTLSGQRPLDSTRGPRRQVIAAAGVLVMLLGASVVAVRMNHTGPSAASAPPVLAVLPFENQGPPADAYFADGLTDEVRNRLTRVARLRVIGGVSARQYKGSTKPPREIARELGATHLLTATVRWERTTDGGGRVRVSPELVRAADQTSVWAEQVEGPLKDVFAMQEQVAERVATALDATLLGQSPGSRATAPPTRNLAAYDAYLRGLAFASWTNRFSPTARRSAIAAFERAVGLDPAFAAAHARLALAYLTAYEIATDSALWEKAHASVARALLLDSTLVETQLARARYFNATGDVEGAYRALQSTVRVAPENAEVHYWIGEVHEMRGHEDSALLSFRRAALLEPRWADPLGGIAGSYDRLFRHPEALRAREEQIALAPHLTWAVVFNAATYLLWRADTAAARRALDNGDPQVVELLTRIPGHFAGRAIWLSVFPRAVLQAKDTITLAGYTRGDWGTPDLFHLMKARHFALTGRPERARAHADSVIALVEPALRPLRHGPGASVLYGIFSERATLAEAYAYAERPADAARTIDQYVADTRQGPLAHWALRVPWALVNAAYVDALIGRRDLAVARLTEALRLPSGEWISRALLRSDPSWAPLRGHPGFERLIAGGGAA